MKVQAHGVLIEVLYHKSKSPELSLGLSRLDTGMGAFPQENVSIL